MTTTEEIIDRERRFLLPTYNRYPLVLERGKGVFLFDLEGNRYLDFVAGLGCQCSRPRPSPGGEDNS